MDQINIVYKDNTISTAEFMRAFTLIDNSIIATTPLTYQAILNSGVDVSANNPIATVLKNDIGEIVWTKTAAGKYVATLANAFPTLKTNVFFTPTDASTPYPYKTDVSAGAITIKFAGNHNLNNVPIKIEVYQ